MIMAEGLRRIRGPFWYADDYPSLSMLLITAELTTQAQNSLVSSQFEQLEVFPITEERSWDKNARIKPIISTKLKACQSSSL